MTEFVNPPEAVAIWTADDDEFFNSLIAAAKPEGPLLSTEAVRSFPQESPLGDYFASLSVSEDEIHVLSKQSLSSIDEFSNIPGIVETPTSEGFRSVYRLGSLNAYVTRYGLRGRKIRVPAAVGEELARLAGRLPKPKAFLSDDKKTITIIAPNIKFYRSIITRVGGYPVKQGYRVALIKSYDLATIVEHTKSHFPSIEISDELKAMRTEPIPGFDGSIESLKAISPEVLTTISSNAQSWKALKNSKATLAEKLAKAGVGSLHDLLFRMPRRYIDKSNPQDIRDLIEGESATIIGTIVSVETLPGQTGGACFTVEDAKGSRIRVAFWRQQWLKTKFHPEDEVIITGKFSWWMQKPQLNGDSIEAAEDASILPIVPIYRQSSTTGLTTYLYMAAVRELIERLNGEIRLPPYLREPQAGAYSQALEALHFPESIPQQRQAIVDLAYYELIYSQLIIQDAKHNEEAHPGVPMEAQEDNLQAKALKSLPYKLTKDQKKAIVTLNERLASSKPSASLLVADVGSGKTLVAQMAALRAIEAGYQTVIIGPTDNLARQLHATTEKLFSGVTRMGGEGLRIGFLAGSLKARERKALLKELEEGRLDVLVGTQAVLSDSVRYHNLGLVIADEQQKFGVEQRSKLLKARADGRIPHLLLQTATPSPRTTAQLMYGDIDIIEMHQKPEGRLPIETEWYERDPLEVIGEPIHPIWADIQEEASKGNQTFVITPMVTDSGKTDAASVERSFKALSQNILSNLRVGFIHGQMKTEEQVTTLTAFRNHELDVLVASTVIEVGVDIPDATRVVILSADRLGASSLHQIRGRVGRSAKPSKCYLVTLAKTDSSRRRVGALVDSQDGFEIAKIDLETRGEGTLFSTEQSGASQMLFATLADHGDRIAQAKDEAQRILKTPLRSLALADAHEKFQSTERLL